MYMYIRVHTYILRVDIPGEGHGYKNILYIRVYKHMHTCILQVDVPGEGRVELKLRIFVSNSDDSKVRTRVFHVHMTRICMHDYV
jgi:hypothetical protein